MMAYSPLSPSAVACRRAWMIGSETLTALLSMSAMLDAMIAAARTPEEAAAEIRGVATRVTECAVAKRSF